MDEETCRVLKADRAKTAQYHKGHNFALSVCRYGLWASRCLFLRPFETNNLQYLQILGVSLVVCKANRPVALCNGIGQNVVAAEFWIDVFRLEVLELSLWEAC